MTARPAPKAKKPALRRAEAREKLNEVTEVVSLAATTSSLQSRNGADNDTAAKLDVVETRSVLEREWYVLEAQQHTLPRPVNTNMPPQRNMSLNPPRPRPTRTRQTLPRNTHNRCRRPTRLAPTIYIHLHSPTVI